MSNQQEWTHLSWDKDLKIRMLETADHYVEQLSDQKADWRNYYVEVNQQVFQQVPDSQS